jgi:mono/diheme cytochrome c family protein
MIKIRRRWLGAAIVALVVILGAGAARAADSASEKQLFRRGAMLWPHYCAYCHNARPASEFNPEQWKLIMMHMRVRANFPAEDAEAIQAFLRDSH